MFTEKKTVNRAEWSWQRSKNHLQGLWMLSAMAGLPLLLGWMLAGPDLSLWIMGPAAILFFLAPSIPVAWIMRMHQAIPLERHQAPQLHRNLENLARRAGLEWLPTLYYVPTRTLNAFALGEGREAAVALTDGLLSRLNDRELAGVIAHEICHIRNRDTWFMTLADLFRRVTTSFAQLGQMLVVAVFVLMALGDHEVNISWPALLILMFSPVLGGLLQMAFSRTREFQADLDAAALTGDPEGLASALAKLNDGVFGYWGRVFRTRTSGMDWLRTHPDPKERIERLLALTEPTYQQVHPMSGSPRLQPFSIRIPMPYRHGIPVFPDTVWRW